MLRLTRCLSGSFALRLEECVDFSRFSLLLKILTSRLPSACHNSCPLYEGIYMLKRVIKSVSPSHLSSVNHSKRCFQGCPPCSFKCNEVLHKHLHPLCSWKPQRTFKCKMATPESKKQPTPEEWRCLNQFTSCLSRSIMEGLLSPMQSPIETIQTRDSENKHRKALLRTKLSMIKEIAERLERDIMLEALMSIRLQLTHTQVSSQKSPLSYYATELASKVMRQGIASARTRMQNIQQIADSLLLPLVVLTSSDAQPLQHDMPQIDVKRTTGGGGLECDGFLQRFADEMASRCLSEALRNLAINSLP